MEDEEDDKIICVDFGSVTMVKRSELKISKQPDFSAQKKKAKEAEKKRGRKPLAMTFASLDRVTPMYVPKDCGPQFRQTNVMDAFRSVPVDKLATEENLRKRKMERQATEEAAAPPPLSHQVGSDEDDENEELFDAPRRRDPIIKPVSEKSSSDPPAGISTGAKIAPKKPKKELPASLSITWNIQEEVPYTVPTWRRELFKGRGFPDEVKRQRMKRWAQDGAEWKKWRAENNTVGASAYASLCGYSSYDAALDLMWKLAGKNKTGDRNDNVYTMIGHLLEPVNVFTFLDMMRYKFKVSKCKQQDIGVVYNLLNNWGTASLDGLVLGDAKFLMATEMDEEGLLHALPPEKSGADGRELLEIDLDHAILECKCHSTKRHQQAPLEQIIQMTWQLGTARTHEKDPDLKDKSMAFLNHLYAPYDRLDNTEGAEAFTLSKFKNWEQKTWLMMFHEPLYQWMVDRATNKTDGFRKVYEQFVEDTTRVTELAEEFPWILEKRKDLFETNPELRPRIYQLPTMYFKYAGPMSCQVGTPSEREIFLDDIRLAISDPSSTVPMKLTRWARKS